MANDELNIPPEEVETQRKRAFVASGLGWGLDGFDWTMFAYALPAITASLSISASDGPFVVAVSLVASAFGGVVGGTLADRFGRVRVLTFVILGYSLFTRSYGDGAEPRAAAPVADAARLHVRGRVGGRGGAAGRVREPEAARPDDGIPAEHVCNRLGRAPRPPT